MLLWIGSLCVALADEPVKLEALPPVVLATLARQWPTAHGVSAQRDGEELEVVMADGAREFEAIVRPDGTWKETEEKMDPAKLPEPVRAAAAARGKIVRSELRTAAEGTVDYEVVVHAKGKDVELHVSVAGVIAAEPAKEEEEEREDKDEDDDDGH